MVPTPGQKSKGFSQTGKPKFCLASKRDVLECMRKAYFNPTTKIAHHVGFLRALSLTFSADVIVKFEAPEITGHEADLLTQGNLLTQNQTIASIDATGRSTDIVQSGKREPLDRASNETEELLGSNLAPSRAVLQEAPAARQEESEITVPQQKPGRYSLRRLGPPVNRVSEKQSRVLAERNPNIGTPSPGVQRKRKPDHEDANLIQRSTRRKRLKSSKTMKTLDVGNVE